MRDQRCNATRCDVIDARDRDAARDAMMALMEQCRTAHTSDDPTRPMVLGATMSALLRGRRAQHLGWSSRWARN